MDGILAALNEWGSPVAAILGWCVISVIVGLAFARVIRNADRGL